MAEPKVSQQFIDEMKSLDAPLPWSLTELGQITDANNYIIARIVGQNGLRIAAMIVVAVNGSFRATRGDDAPTDK